MAFVETKIETKFGQFNVRAYEGPQGKETLVLYTDNIDPFSPVLVRVHSECLTGDLIKSLHCDCGDQFNKSLQLIRKTGGALIYLRQEGRGIGLVEKLKAYHLQRQGHDTFEANVLLGHRPDARSYEMVKIALSDLNISSIRLLTNNPSKVSEIAKHGITVEERVPLIIKSNKHNKNYFSIKKNKFSHSFDDASQHYFYQFHVDNSDEVIAIGNFLKNSLKDPLLKIYVGINATKKTLDTPEEIARIESIYGACLTFHFLTPVLHYSFRDSKDVISDLYAIEGRFPYIKNLQLNDLPHIEVKAIKKAAKMFSLDLPLCDATFENIHHKKLRKLIQKYDICVCLDNSKGKGIQESKETLMTKIDTLLNYGINNLALYGGFGPNQLDLYFEMRRHYKINFSIDAESKLKTNNAIDLDKTKLYLQQLIRFDDPKKEGISQTREFQSQIRRSDWETFAIDGHTFDVHPLVFHAGHFPSTKWFAAELSKLTATDKAFCEVGSGSGAICCLLSMNHPHLQVTATDINPHASENTKLNAQKHHLHITAHTGDVLDNLPPDQLFDTIFWALPFGFLDPGTEITLEEAQVFDPGYRAIRKLFEKARKHLTPNGRLLLGFSSDLGHPTLLNQLASDHAFTLTPVASTTITESIPLRFELLSAIPK